MINIDAADVTLWLTDATLVGLAYFAGRTHGFYLSCAQYRDCLERFITEIKSMRQLVDRLRDVEAVRRVHNDPYN